MFLYEGRSIIYTYLNKRSSIKGCARVVDGIERPVFYKGARCGSYRHYSERRLIKLLTIFNPEKYDG